MSTSGALLLESRAKRFVSFIVYSLPSSLHRPPPSMAVAPSTALGWRTTAAAAGSAAKVVEAASATTDVAAAAVTTVTSGTQ